MITLFFLFFLVFFILFLFFRELIFSWHLYLVFEIYLTFLIITKVKGRSAENVSFSFQCIKNLVSTCGPFIILDPASGNLGIISERNCII